jgi:hypothetical protein
MNGESDFSFEGSDEEGKEADPLTKEIHTGERVLEYVNEYMDKIPDDLENRTKSYLKHAETNRETWERMLNKLIPEEQLVFRCALARGLEDFYYTHYNALRRRLLKDGLTEN